MNYHPVSIYYIIMFRSWKRIISYSITFKQYRIPSTMTHMKLKGQGVGEKVIVYHIMYCGFIYFSGYQFSWIEKKLYYLSYLIKGFPKSACNHKKKLYVYLKICGSSTYILKIHKKLYPRKIKNVRYQTSFCCISSNLGMFVFSMFRILWMNVTR